MSLVSVNRLALHHWCAAAATLTSATATQSASAIGASAVGTMSTAAISIAALRARCTAQPRRMSAPDTHPPATEPTSATR
jgi:hypothetical protein